jgi:GNAT superfamily N-acetyltransferase
VREPLRDVSISAPDAEAPKGVLNFDIRDYTPDDAAAVRRCVVELQEFERAIDPRLRPGELMADAYCEQMHARCRHANGQIFVAEADGAVAGFVAVLARQRFTELDEPPGTYALVTDLVVLPASRRRGIGRTLLDRAEAFARSAGAAELRIGVLTANSFARQLYLDAEFLPHLEILTKRLSG